MILGSGDKNFGEAVDALSNYWNDFFDNSNDAGEVQRQQFEASDDFDFLFGNDVGGKIYNMHSKMNPLFYYSWP